MLIGGIKANNLGGTWLLIQSKVHAVAPQDLWKQVIKIPEWSNWPGADGTVMYCLLGCVDSNFWSIYVKQLLGLIEMVAYGA